MYSHVKLDQIRSEVQRMRDQEDPNRKAKKKIRNPLGMIDAEIDDQMKLPIGTEYDFIIKDKQDLIDQEKMQNNIKMDQLVEKLGYMDFRDALACNKYVIEARKSRDHE
jgi:hypothetical protein